MAAFMCDTSDNFLPSSELSKVEKEMPHLTDAELNQKLRGLSGVDELFCKLLASDYYAHLDADFKKRFGEKSKELLELFRTIYAYGVIVGRTIEKKEQERHKG